MAKKTRAPARRNPVARAARQIHRGGVRGKTRKAERRAEKMQTRKLQTAGDNRYVVEYRLVHDHVVRVGIIAASEEDATRIAAEQFNDGTLWDDTPGRPLLADDFEEQDDNTLEFKVVETIEAGKPWPTADASVKGVRQNKAAMEACRRLVDAYGNGEESGKSIEWEVVDLAYEAALEALGQEEGG
ncbi:MAG: hypothetical protein ACYDHY_15985 [Acidiferrobacterales bacterium]